MVFFQYGGTYFFLQSSAIIVGKFTLANMGTNCVNWFNNLRNFGVCWRITIKSRFGWLKRLYPWWNSSFFIWFDTLMICKFVKCGYSIQCLTQLKKLIFSSRSWSMPRTLVMGHEDRVLERVDSARFLVFLILLLVDVL